MRAAVALAIALTLPGWAAAGTADDAAVTVTHAVAEFGEPKYGPGFRHFDYANPDAPKGGTLRLNAIGSFDTLNLLPVQGEAERHLDLIYASLMVANQEEIRVHYGPLADSGAYTDDRYAACFPRRN